jgi:hypothetical protein
MAHERRGERTRDPLRRTRRAGGLAGALIAALLLPACDGGDPVGPGAPPADPPDVGIARDAASPRALVGEWARDEVVEIDGAAARRTTIWRFDASGSFDGTRFRRDPFRAAGTCRLTIAFFPGSGLEPLVEESVCVYEASAGSLTLRFPGVPRDGRDDVEERVRWSLRGSGVLLLDGVAYLRTGG